VPCGLSLNLSLFGLGSSSIVDVSNLCLSSNKTFLLFFSLSFYYISLVFLSLILLYFSCLPLSHYLIWFNLFHPFPLHCS
jgi:hypothetical protein